MIVVDSSVWIANLRGLDSPAVHRLRSFGPDEEIVVGDLILLEILQGARSERHARQLRRDFEAHGIHPMLNEQIAVQAAANYRALRALGATVRKTVDLIIATFCIEHGHEILHQDRDFSHFETHLGLQVLR